MPASPADRLVVNTIKGLTIDAVEAARSGHPGMPMGTADLAYVLWSRFLVHDPSDPSWPDRDRFVLSAGHGSMLIYSLLHLTGYDLSLGEIRNFRQWGSQTPGHPEYGHTVGVETTTGPLGQGIANAVGMALAEQILRDRFGAELADHWTYCICGDGDLMEGVAAEASSLAGHLQLGRLVVLYDDNEITIDGRTDMAFTEDVAGRYTAYGWHVQKIDGHDHDAVASAIEAARASDRPSLICCRTVIGQGAPNKQDTSGVHGAPLGPDELVLAKETIGLDPTQSFVVPEAALATFRERNGELRARREAWQARYAASARKAEWDTWHSDPDLDAIDWPTWSADDKPLATRKACQAAINAIAARVPNLIGGSADLSGSNGCVLKETTALQADNYGGRLMHFGVREHGMGSVCNGMALHGGIVPFNATFLVFHDYMRPSVRLASMMGQQVVFVYSHDSILLGEDGPTHQPVEHMMALRLIPGLVTLRPGDANETAAAWKVAMARTDGPTCLVTTRQGLPHLAGTAELAMAGVAQGAYVLSDAASDAQVVLIGTGSELQLAVGAQAALAEQGVAARVVSMPSWALFAAQDKATRDAVLPPGVPRVSVEAGRTLGWQAWVGLDGASVGLDRFGASAPHTVLAEKLGFTVDAVVEAARSVI